MGLRPVGGVSSGRNSHVQSSVAVVAAVNSLKPSRVALIRSVDTNADAENPPNYTSYPWPQVWRVMCLPILILISVFEWVKIRVQKLLGFCQNGSKYEDLLELCQKYFTRASRTCPEHRNEQQAIAHYWHHAGGEGDSWVEAAYCLNPIVLSTVTRTLRRIRADRLSHPSMLAKVRWFVEAILQPASPFTPDDDGRRTAAKLVKMRILAVHPDKFQSRARNADGFCLKNTRTLLELVSEVQEWIRDPHLALQMIGAANEPAEGTQLREV